MTAKSFFAPFFLVISIVLVQSCAQKYEGYKCQTGKVVELDFQNISPISDSTFIVIDDLRIEHTVHEEDWKRIRVFKNNRTDVLEDYYCSIPGSEMHLFDSNTGRRLIEVNTSFFIANKLGQAIISHLNANDERVYSILNGHEFRINGKVRFGKVNGDDINICIPKDYPVRIKITE